MKKLSFQLMAVLMCFMILSMPVSSFVQPIGSAIQTSGAERMEAVEACFVDEISDELVCVTVEETSGASREGIIPSKLNPGTGELFSVSLDLSLPNYAELTSANILFVQKGSNVVVRNIDVLSVVRNQPPMSSMTYNVNLNAPNTAGDYVLRYEIKGRTTSGGSIVMLLTSSVDISVGATTCPPATSTAWANVQTSSSVNGQWQTRTVYSVNNACATTAVMEYRTVCNSGYYIQGMSSTTTVAPGYKNCVAGASSVQGLSCGFCQGDSLVKYDGYMSRASDAIEMNSLDRFLVSIGLKSVPREAQVGDACSVLETSAGNPLLPYSSDVKCESGVATVNLDYFKPEITEVYLKVNDDFVRIDANKDGSVAIPKAYQSPRNGFQEGGIIELMVGFSNRGAKVYDERNAPENIVAEVKAAEVSWGTNTWWGISHITKNIFSKRTYVAPRNVELLDEGADFTEGRESFFRQALQVFSLTIAPITGGASLLAMPVLDGTGALAGRLADSNYVVIKGKQANAIAAHPLYNRAILEVAVYSREAGYYAYNYPRASIPRDMAAQTIQVRQSCQPGEGERFFVSTVDILLTPPLLLSNGEVYHRSYGDMTTPGDAAKSLIGRIGTVSEGYVIMNVRVPSDPIRDVTRPIGATPRSNYDEDGNYLLHIAMFDRCWDGVSGPTYVTNVATSFQVEQGVPDDTTLWDCCRFDTFASPFFYNWEFVQRGQCEGTGRTFISRDDSRWNRCTMPVNLVPCYFCESEGGIKKTSVRHDLTAKGCLDQNKLGVPKDHFLVEADAEQVCGAPAGVKCYTCQSRTPGVVETLPNYEICPNDAVPGGKYYFDADFFGTDEWIEMCGLSLTNCYACDDDSEAGYELFVSSTGQELFDIVNGGEAQTCEALGKNIYSLSGVGKCKSVNEFAVVNPNNPDEWCLAFAGQDVVDYCSDAENVFPRKTGMKINELDNLPGYISMNVWDGDALRVSALIQEETNPICISRIGDVMCKEDSECIQALNLDGSEFRKNKAVFMALRKHAFTPATKVLVLARYNWISKFISGSTVTDMVLKDYGLCIKKDVNPWDSLKNLIANLFGLEPDNPTVTYILIGLLILLVLLIFYLVQPRQGKQNINVGGGGYY
jgi:hypothetical protein